MDELEALLPDRGGSSSGQIQQAIQVDAGWLDQLHNDIVGSVVGMVGLHSVPATILWSSLILFAIWRQVALLWARQDNGLKLIHKLIQIYFAQWLAWNWPLFADAWTHMWAQAGLAAAGQSPTAQNMLSGSFVWATYQSLAGQILDTVFTLSWSWAEAYITGMYLIIAPMYLGSAFVVLISGAVMALQVFVMTTLYKLAVAVTWMLIPMMVLRWTAPFAERGISLIAGYGIDMFVLSFFIARTTVFMVERFPEITGNASFNSAANMAMLSVASLFLGLFARKFAAELRSGAPMINAEEAIASAQTAAKAVTAAAGAMLGAASVGAGAAVVARGMSLTAQAAQAGGNAAGIASVPSKTAMAVVDRAAGLSAQASSRIADGVNRAETAYEKAIASGADLREASQRRYAELRSLARGEVAKAGGEGGLAHERSSDLHKRMEDLHKNWSGTVNSRASEDVKAEMTQIAGDTLRSWLEDAAQQANPNAEATTSGVRAALESHTPNPTADLQNARRMGVVGDIYSAALEGLDTRQTVDRLGDRLAVFDKAALGTSADPMVGKLGMVGSVRDALGVPEDPGACAQWAQRERQRVPAGGQPAASIPQDAPMMDRLVAFRKAVNENRPEVRVKNFLAGRLTAASMGGGGGINIRLGE